MTLSEPMTLVTDLLLSAWCFGLGLRLSLTGLGEGLRARRWWSMAFFASALAALSGGLWHGLVTSLPAALAAALWTLTLWSIGVASAAFLVAAAHAALARRGAQVLAGLALFKLLIYAIASVGRDDFLPALLDYAPTLLLVLALFCWRYWSTREPAAPAVVAGILVAFLAAGVQAARLAPHPSFNHNDLYHLLQMLAFWFLYCGGQRLRDHA